MAIKRWDEHNLAATSRHNIGADNLLLRVFIPLYDEIWFQRRDKF